MKWQTIIALLFLSIIDASSGTQSATQGHIQDSQSRQLWADAATGLMWAGKDSGKDVNWKGAIKYCRDLRVAGYADWRLPAVDELQGIYDDSAYASLPPKKNTEFLAGNVKGNLSLTGTYQWSINRVEDDRGHPSGYGWQFDFWHGSRHKEQLSYSGHTTALCVRTQ